ncbi:hypothetical protein DSCO28_55910 [Desulfosarcina ovata subsp. sediminis]|uniref:Methyltransferase type 11 domain-containing protein n=1 Tax=Desulfosarcina ovata subsp. sediminis TaxID=885957 RepID=A0A5K7ZXM4_9BACT|nr:class I SAM-dependent methyltransferase [Desulfosarcina ovata]BBO85025.1 hypothetical protein DSCO28_55910 [Desulfosarcina ovata subsp. sediminis]
MKTNSDRKLSEKIVEFVNLKNKKVLEVGCGDGRITSLLAGKPKELIAIDPDEIKIMEARKNISGVIFYISPGEHTPFSDEYFDLVIFTLSLHHQDSDSGIEEAKRITKKDGEILVFEPVVEGEVEQVFSFVYNENQDNLDAQKSIQNSGLKIKNNETFTAEWVFDDKLDLCQSLFEYYDLFFDPFIAEKIIIFLGEKSECRPIELSDLMSIQLLKKDQ